MDSTIASKKSQKVLSFSNLQVPGKEKMDNSVVLDVGGQRFRTTTNTLRQLPNTRLGRMCVDGKLDFQKNGEVFFDRNPQVMNSILDLYRTGELHLPSNICYSVVEEELRFFEIPVELVSACCWRHFENNRSERTVVNEMQKFLQGAYPDMSSKWPLSWRMKLWYVLERPRHSIGSKIWSIIFFIFVFMAIFSFVFETDPNFRKPTEVFKQTYLERLNTTLSKAYEALPPVHFMAVTVPTDWLHTLRYVTFTFFLLDFMMRLVTCPDRKQFFKQSRNWLEIMVALKSLVHFLMEKYVFAKETDKISRAETAVSIALYTLSGVRVLRILYLANLFPGLKIVILSFKSSLKDLTMTAACVFSFVVLFSSLVYLAEIVSGFKTFFSILEAMWWSVITMTTVGYGDIYPVGVAGKILGSLCALSGVVILALPIAVIADNFTRYHAHLRSFQQRAVRTGFLKRNPRYSIFQHSEDRCHNLVPAYQACSTTTNRDTHDSPDENGDVHGSEGKCHRNGYDGNHNPTVEDIEEITLPNDVATLEGQKGLHQVRRNQVDIHRERKDIE